jgi:hypothetical protein
MSLLLLYGNPPPTVALNSPADASTPSGVRPVLQFTGTSAESRDLNYQVHIGQQPYKIRLDIPAGKVTSNLTDFPVYVNLADLPQEFHDHVNQTDCRDVRVTNSAGTSLAREIVYYDSATNTGEMHFKADLINSGSHNSYYIYYGNTSYTEPTANSTYGKNSVWTNGYTGVYHLSTGSSMLLGDSTVNSNNLTNNGATAVAGKFSGGARFNGSGAYLTNNTLSVPAFSDICVSYWAFVRPAEYKAGSSFSVGSQDEPNRAHAHSPFTDGTLYWDYGSYTTNRVSTSYTPAAGKWTLIHLRFDGFQAVSVITFDGVIVASGGDGTSPSVALTGLDIGRWVSSSGTWQGDMDEFRVSTSYRDDAWTLAEYKNQNDSLDFYSVGAEEAGGTLVFTSDADAGFVNVTNGGDTQPFTSGNTISYTPQSDIADGTYYWSVLAKDTFGYGIQSTPRTFTVSGAAPPVNTSRGMFFGAT